MLLEVPQARHAWNGFGSTRSSPTWPSRPPPGVEVLWGPEVGPRRRRKLGPLWIAGSPDGRIRAGHHSNQLEIAQGNHELLKSRRPAESRWSPFLTSAMSPLGRAVIRFGMGGLQTCAFRARVRARGPFFPKGSPRRPNLVNHHRGRGALQSPRHTKCWSVNAWRYSERRCRFRRSIVTSRGSAVILCETTGAPLTSCTWP